MKQPRIVWVTVRPRRGLRATTLTFVDESARLIRRFQSNGDFVDVAVDLGTKNRDGYYQFPVEDVQEKFADMAAPWVTRAACVRQRMSEFLESRGLPSHRAPHLGFYFTVDGKRLELQIEDPLEGHNLEVTASEYRQFFR